jgi:type II secretory pathway component PulF
MNKKSQCRFAVVLALLAGLLLGCMIVMAFFVPKMLRIWAEMERELSVFERLVARLSQICVETGFVVLPVLLLVMIVCGRWAVLAGRAAAGERENDADK